MGRLEENGRRVPSRGSPVGGDASSSGAAETSEKVRTEEEAFEGQHGRPGSSDKGGFHGVGRAEASDAVSRGEEGAEVRASGLAAALRSLK